MEHLQKLISPYTKVILEILSILVACSLFLGYLIVNNYLAQFGFWDFNFLNVEYVSAGMLFIVFVIMAFLIILLWEKILKSIRDHLPSNDESRKKKFMGVIRVVTYPLPLALVGIVFLTPINPTSISEFIIVGAQAAVWTATIHILLVLIRRGYPKIKSFGESFVDINSVLDGWKNISNFIFIPFVALFIFVNFVGYTYPLIPRSWGGGEPLPVVLTLNPPSGSPSTMNAELIYQSSDFAFVSIGTSTYLLKQSQIDNIQYLEKGPAFENWLKMFGQ